MRIISLSLQSCIRALCYAVLAGGLLSAIQCSSPEDTGKNPPVLAEVSSLGAVVGDAHVTLHWTDPDSASFRKVQISISPEADPMTEIAAGVEMKEFTGLSNGVAYEFTVCTVDASGNVSTGLSVTATPVAGDDDTVGEVSALSADAGDGMVTLRWTDPASSRLKAVEISCLPGNAEPVRVNPGIGQYSWIGLVNGTRYTFTVSTVDDADVRSAGQTVEALPVAPVVADVSALKATAGDAQVALQWEETAADAFDTIEIAYTPGGSTPVKVAKGVKTVTVTGLVNRQLHEFTVTAVDQKGRRSSGVKIGSRPFPSTVTLEISYEHGENLAPTAWKNMYVIWVENRALNFLQNLRICDRLVPEISGKDPVTGIALPFWKMNRYGSSDADEVHAVTSATVANADFTITRVLKDITKHQFTVYFETDRSFEPNDWFGDQPALLYSAAVDLDSEVSEYELTPHGWTPNAETENVIPSTPAGSLQRELRYITNTRVGDGFGAADTRSATRMVKRIMLRIK